MSEIKLKGRTYNGQLREYTINDVLTKGHVGVGWNPILFDLMSELIEHGWDGTILQIKEKFGGLRFYVERADDKLYSIIRKYEDRSLYICEICGAPGTLRGPADRRFWLKTNCDRCYEEWIAKNKHQFTS